MDFDISCKECIYIATCEEELKWHMNDSHNQPDPDLEGEDSCNVYDRNYKSKCELMIHRKEYHPNSISICRYFLRGICTFEENIYWFSHKVEEKNIPTTLNEYKFSFCEKIFKRKAEFMKHKK